MPDIHHTPPVFTRREAAAVALYASDPDPDVVRGMLAAAAAVAISRGWTITDEGTIADDCLLTAAPQSRPGWDRARGLAERRQISVIVVPTLGHIGFTWSVWQAEQRFLHRHGVSVASVEPMLDALLTGANR
ncbi:hypothetical protein [Streptomyces sp. WAC01280]|uniref:hypothetical protein n=1 Tax=Streptomyces sp. WAC01280 TaxID=2487424 RepID=UPI000F7900B5|nr:hypothetical protein [Streptomyces sp. WAC01280]RSS57465.1 hypothetical protein EF909_16110 [Streptomyces sp. WAC01280]